jgi:hypothetical protein
VRHSRGDGALHKKGRRIDQEIAALIGRISDCYDTVESGWLFELNHLAVGGLNPCAPPPAAAGQNPILRSHALAQDDRNRALLL